jgi:hypothetical protein
MSNAFTNFLGGIADGIFGTNAYMKDFQHANRLYVQNGYKRAPKFGFIYYVVFNFNQELNLSTEWKSDIGFLVKKSDLPKFQIQTETINQYNRKTVIQTGIKYSPINMEFHDDNGNISRDLWKRYYQYYYADSYLYTNKQQTSRPAKATPLSFEDTKYGTYNFAYGLNGIQNKPFFKSIDIYILHKKRFSQFTLVNPMIGEWQHDSLDQSDDKKIMTNKLNILYESVLYGSGKIRKGKSPSGLVDYYYDRSPSPLSIAGMGTNSLFGPGGVIDGVESIFGEDGSLANAETPLDYLGAAIQGANLVKNIGQLSKAGLQREGYSLLTGALGAVAISGNQPGGFRDALNNGITGAANSLGINIFSNKNSSVNNSTPTQPSKLTGQ